MDLLFHAVSKLFVLWTYNCFVHIRRLVHLAQTVLLPIRSIVAAVVSSLCPLSVANHVG